MAVTQYIGSRYVPLFADPIEWSAQNTYEPLTIVIHQGNSYTSKQAVPKGIDITNDAFWAITGNYNAQVELYRRETARALEVAEGAQGDIDTILPKSDFTESTVKDYIDYGIDEVAALLPASSFAADSTVKDYIDNIATDVLAKTYDNYLIPDMFTGTDTEKMQACFDALVGIGGNIVLNRNYSVGEIVVNNDSNNNIRINVVGIGKNNKLNMTGSFTGKSDYLNNGNVSFQNVAFNTNDSTLNCFDCDRLIRLYFDNCVFTGFNDVFHNDTHLMQTVYVTNCLFRAIDGVVFNGITESYDIKFSKCVVEASANFMYIYYGVNINVIDNCIEGLSGFTFKNDYRLRNCNICFNYFEQNATYIDCGASGTALLGLNVYGNVFSENTADKAIILLPNKVYKTLGQFVTIEQNVIPDRSSRVYWVDFVGTPEANIDLNGVYVNHNTKTAVSNFKSCAGYISLHEFEINIGSDYDCVVIFGDTGLESSCVNIPLVSGGVYKIEIVSVNIGGARDASLYAGQRLRNIGFNFTCNDATERAYCAGKSATVTFKVLPNV